MKAWKTRSRRIILNHSKYLTVESHEVELPDGRVFPDWPWVITPDFVIVAATTDTGEFLCFRQGKYGIEGTSLAPVGGYMEPGEDPLKAAKRELLEEMGYETADWVNLGSYRMDPNRGMATGHLFFARNARYVTEPDSDDLEEQELVKLSREEVETAVENMEFKVLVWLTAVILILRHSW